ncbi:MAG: hypothetical protein OXF79_04435 [Chloroflexi bacterium]|nr:hypothetical protein [Chloroflexota bacterium]
MPVTEIERRELVNRLVATIGEESTETLMQCLLTEGRDQLATKDDLKAFATKDDLKALENTLRAELASKDDLKAFATKDDLKMLEKVLRAESNERFAQLEALINTAMGKQMRIYVGLLVGVMLTVWGTSLVYAFG